MSKNHLKIDPTRTALLRRSFAADIRRRFSRFKKTVWNLIATKDAFGLNENKRKLTANAPTDPLTPQYKFLQDDRKLEEFNKWILSQIQAGILTAHSETGAIATAAYISAPWLAKYIESGYRTGMLRAYLEVHKSELSKPAGFIEGSKAEFLRSSFGRPERISKVKMMYTRAWTDLKGVTEEMATQMSRVMADSMAHGRGAVETARLLSKTIDGITKKRALAIARTEIIRVHAEGSLDAFEDLGVKELGVDLEWSTAGDNAVCQKCKSASVGEDGKPIIYTVKQARGLIPRHVGCRCAWLPHIEVPVLNWRRKSA